MTFRRQTYDRVVSLGQWCATAIALKKLGLRSCSGPFDWTGPNESVGHYAELIANGFEGFMEKGNLRKLREDPVEGTEIYQDSVQHWETHHEFKIGVPFEENYAKYRALLDRRIARLLSDLRSGGKVLFVHWRGGGHYERKDVVDAACILRSAFPETTIDLLVLETEKFAKDVAYEELDQGVVVAIGDFYDVDRFGWVMGNEQLVLSVLRGIRVRGRWRNLLRLKTESISRRIRKHFTAKRNGQESA